MLAACGPAGTGFDNVPDALAQEQLIIEAFSALPATAFSAMPRSGTARYDGFIRTSIADEVIAGDLSLTANFGTGALGGQVSDLGSTFRGDFDGTIALRNGRINLNNITADLDGTVANQFNSATFDTQLQGTFAGDNAQAVSGLVLGTVALNAGAPQRIGPEDGAFGAERQ